LARGGHIGEYVSGAVVGDGIEPFWLVPQTVRLAEILKKEIARPLWAGRCVKEIDTLA
jgi:hypothetical protein